MNKPNNYEATNVGDFTPVELGGHTCVIKRVEETTSKSGRPMIRIAIDFDEADKQPAYFATMFKNDIRPDKVWPYQATIYVLTEDASGACSKSFKSFITAVERSNGSECVWGDGFEKWFTGKKVGAVFGEVEEEYNGEVKMRRKHRWFCEYAKAKTVSIPEARLLGNNGAGNAPSGFVNVPDSAMDEIPFG